MARPRKNTNNDDYPALTPKPEKKAQKVAKSLKKQREMTDEEIAALEAAALAEEDEPAKKSGSIVPDAWKKAHPNANCGDEVAKMLEGKDRAEQAQIAKGYGIDYSRWDHLNNGQARMCFGRVLRTLLEKQRKEANVAK